MAATVRERAYQHLRRDLMEGRIGQGERVSPVAVAKELGVSHIPVREAISRLQSEGLVVQKGGRGAFARRPDRRELVELIEFRAILEKDAAAHAARRIDGAQADELKSRCDQLARIASQFASGVPSGSGEADDLWRSWALADLAFHLTVLEAAGNRRVIRAINDARVMIRMFGYRSDPPAAWADLGQYFAENYELHAAICRAIRHHDSKAARKAMGAHMRRARRNLLERFDCIWQRGAEAVELSVEYPESVRQAVLDIEAQRSKLESKPPADQAGS